MVKKKHAPLILILLAVFIWIGWGKLTYSEHSKLDTKKAKEVLSQISTEEKKELSKLIHFALSWNPFAYTLMDEKPMSEMCVINKEYMYTPEELKKRARHLDSCQLKGLEVWQKYAHLFKSDKFLFLTLELWPDAPTCAVALINLPLCQKVVETHLRAFQLAVGELSSVEEVMAIFSDPSCEGFDKVMHDDTCQGLLFGFGENNVRLFTSKKKKNLKIFGDKLFFIRKWLLPRFAADFSSEETKQLKNKYERARKVIRWTYFGHNDLETFLAYYMI